MLPAMKFRSNGVSHQVIEYAANQWYSIYKLYMKGVLIWLIIKNFLV